MVSVHPSDYGFVDPAPPSVTPVWLDPDGQ
jgi:hypothetical protein